MRLLQKTTVALTVSALAMSLVAFPTKAAGNNQVVCTSDQVLPGLGFLPITFSPFVASLFGVNPANCQTQVEPTE